MSNERRIYKYQGTLIGDDRVDSIDIDKLNTITPYLSYNSDTNTFDIGSSLVVDGDFEIGNNLKVDGQAIFNTDIKSYNGAGLFLYDNVGGNENVNIWADVSGQVLYIDYGNEGNPDLDVSVQIPLSSNSTVLTTNNTKTIFGNQSIYTEDGTTNIDLYVYTLKLSASFGGGMGYIYIDYQTSDNNNNVEVNSVTKFTTLTKATEGSIISCICSKETGDGVTVIGNNIRYENGVWYVYRNDTKYSYSYQGQVSNATITNCSQLKKRTV